MMYSKRCFIIFSLLISLFILTGCLSAQKENFSIDEKPSENTPDEQKDPNIDNIKDEQDPYISENDTDITILKEDPQDQKNSSHNEEQNIISKAPEVTPPPLSIAQALKEIKKFFKPPERLVIHNKNPVYLIHDFTSDGLEEICVLGIESEDPENAGIDFLSDFSRLYSNNMHVFPFFLYIFSGKHGVLNVLEKIELGDQAVYESITKFSLCKGRSDPFVVAVSFHTREGSVQQWFVFKNPHVKPLSTLVLLDTFSCKAMVEDINGDDWIDIVLFEKGMEEGIGCETFLTWKKWNGRQFIDYKTTNIVRNLNTFLLHIKELGLAGDESKLIAYAFDPEEQNKNKKLGLTQQEILFHFLDLSKYFNAGETIEFNVLEDINDIIFPEILDNPFYIRDEKGFYAKLSFRIIYSDGVFLIPEVLIYMLKNPFGKQQFVLYPVSGNQDSGEE